MLEKRGNLLDATEDIVAHGCNLCGKFGAGVAAQIAVRWPQARVHYIEKFRSDGWRLGDVQLVNCGDKLVANLGVQPTYGRTGKHVDYDALRTACAALFAQAVTMGLRVAMPRIGCGYGGGDWASVSRTLHEAMQPSGFRTDDLTIYIGK